MIHCPPELFFCLTDSFMKLHFINVADHQQINVTRHRGLAGCVIAMHKSEIQLSGQG